MRELLIHRDFRLLLGAQTLSMFGDWTLLLVFGIWAKTLTGNASVAALMVFAMAAPALLAPLGAVFIDRLPRRASIAVLGAASAGVLLLLWFVRGPEDLWILVVVAVWIGFSGVVMNAAVTALVQDLLAADLLGRANSLLATVRQGLRLFAPLLGAGVFATAGGAVVATIDAATFLVSAALILLIRKPETRRAPEAAGLAVQMAAGIRHLAGTPILRRYIVVSILLFSGFGLIDAAIFALIDVLRQPPTFVGVLVTAQGGAAVLVGAVSTALAARVRPEAVGAAGAALSFIGLGLLTIASLPTAFAGFVVMGAALPLVGIASVTLLQLHTPSDRIGRASAAFDAVSSGVYTGMIALGALLIGLVPVPWVLAASATAALAAALMAIRSARTGRRDRITTASRPSLRHP